LFFFKDDYSIAENAVTFVPGSLIASQQACLTIYTTQDAISESDETVKINANAVNSMDSFMTGKDEFEFQILDDDCKHEDS